MDLEPKSIESIASSILQKRDEAMEYRAASGVEKRWREDESAYNGLEMATKTGEMIDYVTGDAVAAQNQSSNRSMASINIIRPRVDTAVGRFADIQMPVDARNWGLATTPVPEMADKNFRNQKATYQGQPITRADGSEATMSDLAKIEKDKAEAAMSKMEREIDDQLTECGFNGECRRAIADAARLGTGILKGPGVVKKLKKSWRRNSDGETTVQELEVEESFEPESKRVDPWKVYPDPDCEEDIRRAAYIFERDTILPRELRMLKGVPGYLNDQIDKCLAELPIRTSAEYNDKDRNWRKKTQLASTGSQYERWEYHGDVSVEDLESLGCDCDGENKSYSACIVFVNDRPIKAMLNPLDTGDIPYDFFQWAEVIGSPWGIGIPRLMHWGQRIVTGAIRAMMDNAGDSAGANIIIDRKIVSPADGKWELTGKKLWFMISEEGDVNKAFAQFQITSMQKELQSIIELILRFVDIETSLPMLFQGEKGSAPETLGATNIMVDANNVALRTRVRIWDDRITKPHITRYYHWNMQYNDDDSIKGDYNVATKGASVNLERDQRAQALFGVMNLMQDPEIAAMVEKTEMVKQLFSSLRLDILKPDEQIEQEAEQRKNQQPPPPPEIQLAQMKAEAEMQKITEQIKADGEKFQAQAIEADKDRQFQVQMKELDRQMKMMELSATSGMSLDKIKAELSKEAAKINLQRELSDKKGYGPQVASPPVEPAGRAPEGMAYQR